MLDRATVSNPLMKRMVQISGPQSPNQIPFVIAKRYHNLRYIADGSYGVVVSAVDGLAQLTGEPSAVAIKRCHNTLASAKDAKHLLREVRLLAALDHENILHIRDIDLPASYASWADVYLVTPLLPCGSLSGRLSRYAAEHPGSPLPDAAIKTTLTGLARALLYMQSASVAHRDLKTANVLVHDDWTPVLCDLGLARAIDYDEGDLTTGVVTRSYRAPELFFTPTAYTNKLDMWSVGCILAELIRPGFPLFRKGRAHSTELAAILDVIGTPSEEEMENAFPDRASRTYLRWQFGGRAAFDPLSRGKERPSLRERFSSVEVDEKLLDILESLLELDPEKRMSPEELLESEYLAEVRDVGKEKVVSEERRGEILDMEPPAKCGKDFVKRALWAEAATYHPEEAKAMENQGQGPKSAKSRFFGGFKFSHHVSTEAVPN